MRLLDDNTVLWTPEDHTRGWGCDFWTKRTLETLLGVGEPLTYERTPLDERIESREQTFRRLLAVLLRERHRQTVVAAPEPVDESLDATFDAMDEALDILESTDSDIVLTNVTVAGQIRDTFVTTQIPFVMRKNGNIEVRTTMAVTSWEIDDEFASSKEGAAHRELALGAYLLQLAGVRPVDGAILLSESGADSNLRFSVRRRKSRIGVETPLHRQMSYGRSDYVPGQRYRGWETFAKFLANYAASIPDQASEYEDGENACGRENCAACAAPSLEFRDLSRIHMIGFARPTLRDMGLRTIDELAAWDGDTDEDYDSLRVRAQLQVAERPPDGSPGVPSVRVVRRAPINRLPDPTEGDIHFDFENDPQWQPSDVRFEAVPGLIYLAGLVDTSDGSYRALWAHDRAQEQQLLDDLFTALEAQRQRYPASHAYHYGTHELDQIEMALDRARSDSLFERFDALVADRVFVNLFDGCVDRAIITGAWGHNLSIKSLEHYYMPEQRTGDEQMGGLQSIFEYWAATEAREDGHTTEWQKHLDSLATYNEYDCRSTVRLHQWLLELVQK